MKQKRHTTDEIIAKLRQADVELGKGKTVPEVCYIMAIRMRILAQFAFFTNG